jgi:hypothetical protein
MIGAEDFAMRHTLRFLTAPLVVASLQAAGCQCCNNQCCHEQCYSYAQAAVRPIPAAPVPAKKDVIQPDYLPGTKVTAEPPQVDTMATSSPAEPTTETTAAKPQLAKLAHAPDYRWVIGELWYTDGGWRIHYGDDKDPDQFGGLLMLSDTGPMGDYHIGQMIYVEGQLIDAGEKSVYRVSRMMEAAPPEAQPTLKATGTP